MIPQSEHLFNNCSGNLYDRGTYPRWNEIDSVVLYFRTSPDRGNQRLSPTCQSDQLEAWANDLGKPVAGSFIDRGCDGRTIGMKRRGLLQAIDLAQQLNCPIVAWHWQRFCRESHKLNRYAVDFVSYWPLSMPEETVNADSNRRSIAHRRKSGKPHGAYVNVSVPTLLYVFNRLAVGTSYRSIAGELQTLSGLSWDHRKIGRLLRGHGIVYRSELLGGKPLVS